MRFYLAERHFCKEYVVCLTILRLFCTRFFSPLSKGFERCIMIAVVVVVVAYLSVS